MKTGKILTFLVMVALLFFGCKTNDNKQVNKNYWIQNTTEVKSGFIGLKPGMSFLSTEGLSFYFTLTNYNSTSSIKLSTNDCFKCKDSIGIFIPMKLKPDDFIISLEPNETKTEVLMFNVNPESKGELEFIFQSATDAEAISLFVKR